MTNTTIDEQDYALLLAEFRKQRRLAIFLAIVNLALFGVLIYKWNEPKPRLIEAKADVPVASLQVAKAGCVILLSPTLERVESHPPQVIPKGSYMAPQCLAPGQEI